MSQHMSPKAMRRAARIARACADGRRAAYDEIRIAEDRKIPALLAKSAAHDVAEIERIEDLAELRAPLSNILKDAA